MTEPDRPLRIALLTYRGKPTSGGQGVYVRHLSRELAALGHQVDVISGPPHPVLDAGVAQHALGGLDLYADDNPFRTPRPNELRTLPAWIEYLSMRRGGFGEPLAFSLRARHHLRRHHYDVIHDNQGLGYGLLGLRPLVATIHHPITIDRWAERATAGERRRRELDAWYSFIPMQRRVARRIPMILTPAEAGRIAVTEWAQVPSGRITVTPLGVDSSVFHPVAGVPRVPGRIVTTASADVPIKGLSHLLTAFAQVSQDVPAELHVVGRPRPGGTTETLIAELGIGDSVRFHQHLADRALADLLRSAAVACVPSLYEGFCLPALEAMACGTALVATTAGAIPEVTGVDGQCAMHVPPGRPSAMADALATVLTQDTLRGQLGDRGARRARQYTWRRTAYATVAAYRALLDQTVTGPFLRSNRREASGRAAC